MSSPFRPGEPQRPLFGQSTTSQGGSFSVAGMPPAGASQLSASTWGASTPGASFGASLSDSLSQSRPHYTPGYMMSTSQGSTPQSSSQRHDDVPVVQTRAKLNNPLSRNAASDFGMESMFQNSRQRPLLMDEDAPPTASVNDMFNDHSSNRTSSYRPPTFAKSTNRDTRTEAPRTPLSSQLLYVIVFGYPTDRYSATVEYFRSLGENPTEADPHADIVNCFRIGYRNPVEAVRAIRKNGEILSGTWMVGAKWADAVQAESVLGSTNAYASIPGASSTPSLGSSIPSNVDVDMDQGVLSGPGMGALVPTTTVGTPISLAPSAAAFRQPTASHIPSTPAAPGGFASSATASGSSKGIVGQVSDLIFGW